MLQNIHIIIAGLLTAIAALYQIECNTERWKAVEVANILVPPEHLARFVSNAEAASKWFHWVSNFKEADTRPLGIGKKYQAFYSIPVIGEIIMLFRLTEYEPNYLYALESDSFLKPKFTMLLKTTKDGKTLLTLSLEFRRSSALYHITAGPLFWFLSSQQLRHSLLYLKMMFPF